MTKQSIFSLVSIIFAGLFFYACAGSGALSSNNAREYDRNFDKMAKIVEKAISGYDLNIDNISESEGKMVLTVSRGQYINNDEIQQDKGEVRIIRISEQKTRVEVENPDYHFSVPDHQREDYQRILFLRIKKLLNK